MCDWRVVKTHHHELLQLVQSVKVSSPLQEMAGGHEVAAAALQAWVHLLQQALQRPQAAALQAGLQHSLQEHLIWALLARTCALKRKKKVKGHVISIAALAR